MESTGRCRVIDSAVLKDIYAIPFYKDVLNHSEMVKMWLRLPFSKTKSPEFLVNKGNSGLIQQGMRESNVV